MSKFVWAILGLSLYLAACTPNEPEIVRVTATSAPNIAQVATATPLPAQDAQAPATQTPAPTAIPSATPAAPSALYMGEPVNPPVKLQNWTFPVSTGGTAQLSDYDGKWRLIFFGYLNCPDFCPLTLSDYRKVKRFLETDAQNVVFMYISVDGDRDTPERMADFLDNYDPEFIGFQGNDADLIQIQPDYGFYYRRNLATGTSTSYTVDHSTRSYLVDPEGNLVANFLYSTAPNVIAEAIRGHMAQYQGRTS